MAAIWSKSDGAALGLAIEPIVQDIMAARRALVASTTAGICMRFQVGQCHRGNACPQRHIRIEKSVCKHWLRGLCKKGDLCEFLHEYDLSKMPPCHFFLTFGKCSNPECPFLHVKPEDVVRDCPWYARGFCKQGPNCKNRHVRVVACPKYLAGFCPDGPNCKLGHAKHEIPDIEPVMSHSAAQVRQHYTPDHKAKQPQNTGSNINRPLSEVRCFKCGEMGHYANHCPNQRRPAPPGGFGAAAAGPGNAPIKDPRAAAAAKAGITPDRVKAVAAMLGLNADVLMASGIDITLLEGPQGRQIAAQAGLLHPSNALAPGANAMRAGAAAAGAGAGPYGGGAPPAGAGAGAAGFYGGAAPYPGGPTSAPVAKKLQAMEF